MFYNRDHEPISTKEAGRLMRNKTGRRIAETKIGEYIISTVFLVMDHGFDEDQPVLYETMVFGTDRLAVGEYTERYFTATAALAGHDQIAAELRCLQELSY